MLSDVAHDGNVEALASQGEGPQVALDGIIDVRVATRLFGDVDAYDASNASGEAMLEHATAAASRVEHNVVRADVREDRLEEAVVHSLEVGGVEAVAQLPCSPTKAEEPHALSESLRAGKVGNKKWRRLALTFVAAQC